MPSRLRQQALRLAERMVRNPGSPGPARQGVTREAGYILLGALCASGLPKGQKVGLSRGILLPQSSSCLPGSLVFDVCNVSAAAEDAAEPRRAWNCQGHTLMSTQLAHDLYIPSTQAETLNSH